MNERLRAQLLQPLIVDQVFRWMAREHPELIPPVNPHNALIEKLFGDQGGY